MRYFKPGMLTIFGFLLISNISYILYMVTGNVIFGYIGIGNYGFRLLLFASTSYFAPVRYLSLLPVAYFGIHLIRSNNNELVEKMNLTGGLLIVIGLYQFIWSIIRIITFMFSFDILYPIVAELTTFFTLGLILVIITFHSVFFVDPVKGGKLNHYRMRLLGLIAVFPVYFFLILQVMNTYIYEILSLFTEVETISVNRNQIVLTYELSVLFSTLLNMFLILYSAVFVLLTTGIFDKSTTTTNYKETAFPTPDDVQS